MSNAGQDVRIVRVRETVFDQPKPRQGAVVSAFVHLRNSLRQLVEREPRLLRVVQRQDRFASLRAKLHPKFSRQGRPCRGCSGLPRLLDPELPNNQRSNCSGWQSRF